MSCRRVPVERGCGAARVANNRSMGRRLLAVALLVLPARSLQAELRSYTSGPEIARRP